MKLTILAGISAAVLLLAAPMSSRAAETAASNTTTAAVEGLSSTHDHGVVRLVPDPALVGGRLALKVVAFNRDRTPVSFGPGSVKVFTAAGQPVPLVSLEQLEAEVRAANRADRAVDVFGSSGPSVMGRDAAGRPDVSNYTGGSSSMGATFSTRERRSAEADSANPKSQQQIADLRAAILQPLTVPPASAAGGQVVTQKIKFARNEARALRVVVDFNGEQHEFNFAVPPAH